LKYVFEMHLTYFVFCCVDKSNLYFVIEIKLVCFCVIEIHYKILQVTENNTSAVVFGSIWSVQSGYRPMYFVSTSIFIVSFLLTVH